MSTWHRKRGRRWVKIWPPVKQTDSRGNEVLRPNLNATPIVVPYSGQWDRSSIAELPGQQLIDVRLIQVEYSDRTKKIAPWSEVELSDTPGARWDIISPPSLRWGTRGVRHLTLEIQRRPDHG